MSPPGWLAKVPEGARRAGYVRAVDLGVPVLAVEGAHETQVPGMVWSEQGQALCCAAREELGAGEEVQVLSARQLCFPTGEPGAPRGDFAARATALVAQRDGLGLWRAAHLELGEVPEGMLQASALRWLLAVLEVARPDQGLVVALLESLRTGTYQPPGEAKEDEPQARPAPPSALPEQARAILESQLEMLAVPCDPRVMDGRLLAVSTVLTNVLTATGLHDYLVPAEEALAEALKVRSAEPLRLVLADVLDRHVPAAAVALGDDLPAPSPSAPAARAEDGQKQAAKVLKVEPERIEALLDLVGELVVAKNSLPFLARRAEDEFGSSQLARAIKEQYAIVNRITEALQGAVMRVRMVAVSEVFRRFPRLVRDLSGKLNKRIRLELDGEDVEADKDVVQDLFDPLMHLMRNSLDHGLEGPEERTRAGKPPEGTIRLSATGQEDQVVIELSDDGRGIDPSALKAKAIARGFVTAEAAAKLSDEEALQLIFLAGFSTVEKVTDLSGRGVGMDVVRSMVARVGGQLTLKSVVGKGTTTTITLPLTMAVSHVMVVEAGGVAFGIPFSSIEQTVRVPAQDISRIADGEALVLRGRLVPLCRLARALGLTQTPRADDTEALLVARVGGAMVGFVIDEFHEAVDVIVKPLVGVLKDMHRYSGTAMLGDGRVLLILDLAEVTRGGG